MDWNWLLFSANGITQGLLFRATWITHEVFVFLSVATTLSPSPPHLSMPFLLVSVYREVSLCYS